MTLHENKFNPFQVKGLRTGYCEVFATDEKNVQVVSEVDTGMADKADADMSVS